MEKIENKEGFINKAFIFILNMLKSLFKFLKASGINSQIKNIKSNIKTYEEDIIKLEKKVQLGSITKLQKQILKSSKENLRLARIRLEELELKAKDKGIEMVKNGGIVYSPLYNEILPIFEKINQKGLSISEVEVFKSISQFTQNNDLLFDISLNEVKQNNNDFPIQNKIIKSIIGYGNGSNVNTFNNRELLNMTLNLQRFYNDIQNPMNTLAFEELSKLERLLTLGYDYNDIPFEDKISANQMFFLMDKLR